MQKPTAILRVHVKNIFLECLDELNDIRGQKYVGSAIIYYSTDTK